MRAWLDRRPPLRSVGGRPDWGERRTATGRKKKKQRQQRSRNRRPRRRHSLSDGPRPVQIPNDATADAARKRGGRGGVHASSAEEDGGVWTVGARRGGEKRQRAGAGQQPVLAVPAPATPPSPSPPINPAPCSCRCRGRCPLLTPLMPTHSTPLQTAKRFSPRPGLTCHGRACLAATSSPPSFSSFYLFP